jgi:hypothetical protein
MRRALGVALLVLAGCGSELHGKLTAQLPDRAEPLTVAPNRCKSGQRQGFFGVDLWTDGDDAAKIRGVLDPIDGAAVRLELPGAPAPLTLSSQSTCEVFDFLVENEGPTTNDIRHVGGHLLLDCVEAGITLVADITFTNCA